MADDDISLHIKLLASHLAIQNTDTLSKDELRAVLKRYKENLDQLLKVQKEDSKPAQVVCSDYIY